MKIFFIHAFLIVSGCCLLTSNNPETSDLAAKPSQIAVLSPPNAQDARELRGYRRRLDGDADADDSTNVDVDVNSPNDAGNDSGDQQADDSQDGNADSQWDSGADDGSDPEAYDSDQYSYGDDGQYDDEDDQGSGDQYPLDDVMAEIDAWRSSAQASGSVTVTAEQLQDLLNAFPDIPDQDQLALQISDSQSGSQDDSTSQTRRRRRLQSGDDTEAGASAGADAGADTNPAANADSNSVDDSPPSGKDDPNNGADSSADTSSDANADTNTDGSADSGYSGDDVTDDQLNDAVQTSSDAVQGLQSAKATINDWLATANQSSTGSIDLTFDQLDALYNVLADVSEVYENLGSESDEGSDYDYQTEDEQDGMDQDNYDGEENYDDSQDGGDADDSNGDYQNDGPDSDDTQAADSDQSRRRYAMAKNVNQMRNRNNQRRLVFNKQANIRRQISRRNALAKYRAQMRARLNRMKTSAHGPSQLKAQRNRRNAIARHQAVLRLQRNRRNAAIHRAQNTRNNNHNRIYNRNALFAQQASVQHKGYRPNFNRRAGQIGYQVRQTGHYVRAMGNPHRKVADYTSNSTNSYYVGAAANYTVVPDLIVAVEGISTIYNLMSTSIPSQSDAQKSTLDQIASAVQTYAKLRNFAVVLTANNDKLRNQLNYVTNNLSTVQLGMEEVLAFYGYRDRYDGLLLKSMSLSTLFIEKQKILQSECANFTTSTRLVGDSANYLLYVDDALITKTKFLVESPDLGDPTSVQYLKKVDQTILLIPVVIEVVGDTQAAVAKMQTGLYDVRDRRSRLDSILTDMELIVAGKYVAGANDSVASGKGTSHLLVAKALALMLSFLFVGLSL